MPDIDDTPTPASDTPILAEYTAAQKGLVMGKVRDLFTHGEVQKAMSLRDRMKAGIYIAPYEYDPAFVWPEKATAIPGGPKPPRRTGPGSSQQAWLTFASQVSEIEVEVLRAMSRDDIIGVLVERRIIPPNG